MSEKIHIDDELERECDALVEAIGAPTDAEDVAAALRRIDAFAGAHRSSAGSRQAGRALDALRASLLCLAGRYEEALEAWTERANLGLRSPLEAYEIALGRGACFLSMGRPREAIKVLEVTLDRSDLAHDKAIRSLLGTLTEAYAAMGEPLPERWRRVAAQLDPFVREPRSKSYPPPRSFARFGQDEKDPKPHV